MSWRYRDDDAEQTSKELCFLEESEAAKDLFVNVLTVLWLEKCFGLSFKRNLSCQGRRAIRFGSERPFHLANKAWPRLVAHERTKATSPFRGLRCEIRAAVGPKRVVTSGGDGKEGRSTAEKADLRQAGPHRGLCFWQGF